MAFQVVRRKRSEGIGDVAKAISAGLISGMDMAQKKKKLDLESVLLANKFAQSTPEYAKNMAAAKEQGKMSAWGNVGGVVGVPGVQPQAQTSNPILSQQSIQNEEPPFIMVMGKPMANPNYVKPSERAKMAEAESKKKLESDYMRQQADDMLNTIGEVESGLNYFGTFGQIPSIPGTKRNDWQNSFKKLKGRKILDLMSELKRVSKTGATGFGQLNAKELSLLDEASTALSMGTTKEKAKYYLGEMKRLYGKILHPGNKEFMSDADIEARIAELKGSVQND